MIDISKFGRNYFLSIQLFDSVNTGLPSSFLNVELPFTIEFDITRNTYSSANVASIRVFNLSEINRNRIRKNVIDYGDLIVITLKAGYGTNLPVVFNGNITQAWSVREGNNFITQIESFDGGFAFANGFTAASFPAGTPQASILTAMVNGMPGVSLGAIGNSFSGAIGSRGNSYDGGSCDLARQNSNGQFFIDSGKAFFLANNECRKGEIELINADSGLLGTPLREQTFINFDMLFEPRIVVGQYIQLESATDQSFNGAYKVISVKHRGMISDAVCGNAITSLGLDNSAGALQVVTTL
jgi:hypothetical protein